MWRSFDLRPHIYFVTSVSNFKGKRTKKQVHKQKAFVLWVSLGIAFGELGNLRIIKFLIRTKQQVTSVKTWSEWRRAPLQQLQSMTRQLQFPIFRTTEINYSATNSRSVTIELREQENRLNNGGAKEALQVATARKLEARYELLGHGSAADDVAALKDGDGETWPGQIGGGSEAIVATADNKRVPLLLCQGACTQAPAMLSPHSSSLLKSENNNKRFLRKVWVWYNTTGEKKN